MKIRFDHILMLVVLAVFLFFFFSEKQRTYLSGSEAQVYLLLAATFASLFVNLRFKNEFLEILNLVFVLFYICRVPFLFSDNVASDVISRHVDTRDIPWYITVLTIQFLFLVVSILAINPRIPRGNISLKSESLFKKVLEFSLFILLIHFTYIFLFWKYGVDIGINVIAIFLELFQVSNLLMLVIVSAVMVEREILSKYKSAVISFLLLVVVYDLYIGQKSSLLMIMLLAYLAMIVVRGPLVLKVREFLIISMFGVFSFVLYFLGAAVRANWISHAPIFDHVTAMINGGLSTLSNTVSYRIGYFDFFIDKVSNPAYKPYVNFTYYFEALVDKLTPGFDIFNVPFLSRTLYNAYFGKSPEGINNSELLTVFAEGHLLFGFFSFFMYLLILFFIKRLILSFKSSSGFVYGLYYMYIVSFFYSWIVGSGLDMLVAIDLVYKGIFVFFTIYFITTATKSSNKQAS